MLMAMTMKEKVMTVSEQRLKEELIQLLNLIRIFRTRCHPPSLSLHYLMGRQV